MVSEFGGILFIMSDIIHLRTNADTRPDFSSNITVARIPSDYKVTDTIRLLIPTDNNSSSNSEKETRWRLF